MGTMTALKTAIAADRRQACTDTALRTSSAGRATSHGHARGDEKRSRSSLTPCRSEAIRRCTLGPLCCREGTGRRCSVYATWWKLHGAVTAAIMLAVLLQ